MRYDSDHYRCGPYPEVPSPVFPWGEIEFDTDLYLPHVVDALDADVVRVHVIADFGCGSDCPEMVSVTDETGRDVRRLLPASSLDDLYRTVLIKGEEAADGRIRARTH